MRTQAWRQRKEGNASDDANGERWPTTTGNGDVGSYFFKVRREKETTEVKEGSRGRNVSLNLDSGVAAMSSGRVRVYEARYPATLCCADGTRVWLMLDTKARRG